MIIEFIRNHKRSLSAQDWHAIAVEFNRRFEGKKVGSGNVLPPTLKNKKPGAAEPVMSGGSTSKKSHELTERKWTAIKSQIYRWPDIKASIEAELQRIGEQDQDPEPTAEGEEELDDADVVSLPDDYEDDEIPDISP